MPEPDPDTLAPPAAPPPRYRSAYLCDMKARQAMRDHALMAAAAMAIPIPLLDLGVEAGIQVRMVRRLAQIYGVDYAEARARTLVAAALGGFSTGWASSTVLRTVSVASYLTNFWTSAVISSAITYGIGHLFARHFANGGGLHDLSAAQAARELERHARRRAGRRT